MKESVAIVTEADTKKEFSPTKSDNNIQRLRDEHERQLGSLRSVIGNIRHDGGTPSLDSIATELSSMHTAQRASVLLALQRTQGNRYVQRVVAGIQAKLKVGQPGDVYEQEADRMADLVMRMPEQLVQQQPEEEEDLIQTEPIAEQITPLVQRQVEEEEKEEEILQTKELSGQSAEVTPHLESRIQSLKGGGQRLPEAVRAFFEPRFGYDFSQVWVHTDGRAADTAEAVNARAFTSGEDIVFGSGHYMPETETGKRLLAHELVHVVQQSLHNAIGSRVARNVVKQTIQRTTLASIPLQQRLALQIRTQRPVLTPQQIQRFFHQLSSGAWGMTISSPGGASVQLGPGVPTALQTPLTTVAAHLNGITITQSGQSAQLLGPNTVVAVRMDLTSYGGAAGLYRYTLYNVPANGHGGNLLIESLSGGPPVQQQATHTPGAGQAAGTISAGGHTFHLVGVQNLWTPPRIASVQEALSLMPADVLLRAAGLRIGIQSGGLGTGIGSREEGGHYDPNTDTVTLYRAIWGQVQRPGGVFSPGQQMQHHNPVQVIAHEIAHAIDRRILRQAELTYQQSAQTPSDLSALLAARGLSGGRYTVSGESYGFSDVLTTTQGNAFRQAYIQDGASISGGRIQHAVTMYGAQEWQEVYAEAFSLYIVDPEALRQVRPQVYQYFATQFPRQQAGAAPGSGAPAQPTP